MDDRGACAPQDRRFYLLICPKGSGTISLGTLVAQHTDGHIPAVQISHASFN